MPNRLIPDIQFENRTPQEVVDDILGFAYAAGAVGQERDRVFEELREVMVKVIAGAMEYAVNQYASDHRFIVATPEEALGLRREYE